MQQHLRSAVRIYKSFTCSFYVIRVSTLDDAATVVSADRIAALSNLDGDMPQYIADNTDDEMSHSTFLKAYLESIGANPVSLDNFRNLPSSHATGARNVGRLTNLQALNVDLSWYTRYRGTGNPDLGAAFNSPFGGESFQTNLIMPDPCQFLRADLPECSVIRPSSTALGGAVATIKAFTDDLLFFNQPPAFLSLLMDLAVAADAAERLG